MVDIGDCIGFVAAAVTTLSFVPQAVKVLRDRQTAGISLAMYSLFTTGLILWLIWGIITRNTPVYVANSVTLILATTVLGMKIRYGRPALRTPSSDPEGAVVLAEVGRRRPRRRRPISRRP